MANGLDRLSDWALADLQEIADGDRNPGAGRHAGLCWPAFGVGSTRQHGYLGRYISALRGDRLTAEIGHGRQNRSPITQLVSSEMYLFP